MKQTKERLTHVLKNRSYAYLWTGQSISLFGLAIYSTCLPFLVFHAGGGAIELGFAHSFFIAPQILFLLENPILQASAALSGLATMGYMMNSYKLGKWLKYMPEKRR